MADKRPNTLPHDWDVSAYYPGALADVVSLHMTYYAREWNFGAAFETKVAAEMSKFLNRYDPKKHLFLTVRNNGELMGSITIDGDDPQGAHLRWFITSDIARGTGLGRWLMQQAVDFSRQTGASKIWLTTFAGLNAAAHLYTDFGFILTQESEKDQWKGGVTEHRFELQF